MPQKNSPPIFLSTNGEQFFNRVKLYLDDSDFKKIKEAFEMAKREHGNECRRSGEPYFTHPLTVAYYLAEYNLDAPALIAALLHDVAEDTRITVKQIEKQFGSEVSHLVDGVTKLTNVGRDKQLSRYEINQATLHKLFEFTTDDVRVVIIKIFDRLHNMRTIQAMPEHKQREKAKETLTVYAPFANRLGMWLVKTDLESLSLQILHPRAYKQIKHKLEVLEHKHNYLLPKTAQKIREQLHELDVTVIRVAYHPRNIYSIYRDLQLAGKDFDSIDHAMRITLLIDKEINCYTALGGIHQLWHPVAQKFDDYIAVPRENIYRSLHTTVAHESGQNLKLRIRTVPMDRVSEIGVLARWQYSDSLVWGEKVASRIDAFLEKMKETIDLERGNITETVQSVVDNLLGDQIQVHTPKGQIKELRKGATPIDFAYMIHTEVGHQCRGALINGVRVALNQSLQNGDQVLIDKHMRAQPQRIWLDEDLGYIVTGKARTCIKRWYKQLPQEVAIEQGKKLLLEELTVLGFPHKSHEEIASAFNYAGVNDLYRDLGLAEILPTQLATKIAERIWDSWPAKSVGNVVETKDGETYVITHAEGYDLRLCGICDPQPDNTIRGFIRGDGKVTVHRISCHMLKTHPLASNQLKLGWGEQSPANARVITIQIDIHDRVGILNEITGLLAEEQINIDYVAMPWKEQKKHIIFDLNILNPRKLVRILHRIMSLVNVYGVQCMPVSTSLKQ